MKATCLVLALALFTPALAAQGGTRHQQSVSEKTSVEYGSAERTRLLDQVHGRHKATDADQLGSVARRAALTGKRYQGQKRPSAQRHRR